MRVRFRRVPGWGPFATYAVEINPKDLPPQKRQVPSREMLIPRPGVRGEEPKGVERVKETF